MDPYKILGVDQNASREDVLRAYRRQANKYHPDHGGDAWAFQQVREAYEQLSGDGVSQPAATAARGNAAPVTPPPSKQPATGPPASGPTSHRATGPGTPRDVSSGLQWIRQLAFRELPLQNETTTFILVNVLDIFMTYILIRFGGIEANPVARFFLDRWDFSGMIFFKMSIVAFVCVVAQLIAHRNLVRARLVLQFGTLVTGAVVIYGAILFARHFGG